MASNGYGPWMGLVLWALGILAAFPGDVRAEIPANTWVRMGPEAAMGPEASEDGQEPDFRAYSTMEAAPDGRIYYFGGGHNDYGGNDVDAYDVRANRWVQLTEEENWKTDCDQPGWQSWTCGELADMFGRSSEPNEPTPRGRPWAAHVYQMAVWHPQWEEFCHLPGAHGNLWCYDPDKGDQEGAWRELKSNVPFSEAHANFALGWDPGLARLVAFGDADINAAYAYDETSGTWDKLVDLIQNKNWSEIFSEYSPDHGKHLVAGTPWQLVDLETGSVTPVTPLREVSDNHRSSDLIEYAPEIGKFLVVSRTQSGQGQGLWAYDPADDSWTEVHLNGAAPANAWLRWDLFERDPATGTYVQLVVDPDHPERGTPKTFAFRLDGEDAIDSDGEDGALGADDT